MSVLGGGGGGGEGRWRVQFSKVKLNGILVILFLLLFCCCCCCCRFFLFGEFLLFTISHTKKVNKPFVVLRAGGGLQKYVRYMISRKKQPPLSGHPRRTGEWPLNGGWLLNRGSS